MMYNEAHNALLIAMVRFVACRIREQRPDLAYIILCEELWWGLREAEAARMVVGERG